MCCKICTTLCMSTLYLQDDYKGYSAADSTLFPDGLSFCVTWLCSLTDILIPSAMVLLYFLVCLSQPSAWQNGVSISQHWAPAHTIFTTACYSLPGHTDSLATKTTAAHCWGKCRGYLSVPIKQIIAIFRWVEADAEVGIRGKRCLSTPEFCLVVCLLTKISRVLMLRKLVCMALKIELEHFIAQNANNQVIYSVDVQ